jgi:hypothetical protein
MRRLQKNDGTDRHLRAARYHSRRCREKKAEAQFFEELLEESEAKRQALLEKARAVEDKEDELIELTADADGAELSLEDTVRDIADDLGKADRRSPELGAYAKVLPRGVGGVINPEGESQMTAIVAFRSRLNEFKDHPLVQPSLAALDTAIHTLRLRLDSKRACEEALAALFAEEQALRTKVREQLNGAHGRLSTRYQSNPSLADRFFIKDARAGSSAVSRAEERGRAAGKAESFLTLLEGKGIAVPEEEKSKILETLDIAKLERWFAKAITETTLAAILS